MSQFQTTSIIIREESGQAVFKIFNRSYLEVPAAFKYRNVKVESVVEVGVGVITVLSHGPELVTWRNTPSVFGSGPRWS